MNNQFTNLRPTGAALSTAGLPASSREGSLSTAGHSLAPTEASLVPTKRSRVFAEVPVQVGWRHHSALVAT